MLSSKSIRILTLSILALGAAGAAQAAVTIAVVGKESYFNQLGPDPEDLTAEVLDPDYDNYPYAAYASVVVDNQSDISGAWVQPDGGAPIALEWSADENSYEAYQGVESKAALDSLFPAGNYLIWYTPAGGAGDISKTLSLTQTFPDTPFIENWFDLQHYPVGEDVTVRWNAMSGGAADDIITVGISSLLNGDTVFESPVHYFEPGGLDGTARSVTIPAGTLSAGVEYLMLLSFDKVETVDNGVTVPGVLFGSTHYVETNTVIRPVARHPSTVINWGMLSRWTTHQQVGPATVEPLEGDEAAYIYTAIWLENPADLTAATVNGFVLTQEEEGWTSFQAVGDDLDLQNWLSNGEHELNYSFAAGGSHSTNLNLTGGVLPPVQLANWSELQAADASTATPIRWMAPEGVKARDAYLVKVEDSGGNVLWESDLDFNSDAGLNGMDTLVDVPAGILEAGQVYSGSISRLQFTDIDRGSQADTVFVAFNAVETRFTINTGAVVVDPIELGAVVRELYYWQAGPGSPVLSTDNSDQFGTLAVLWGDSADLLSSASVTLPGGEERVMAYDVEEGEFSVKKTNDGFDAMLADFPAGNYVLKYQVSGGAQVEITLDFDQSFPSAPQFINWAEAQSVLASEPFTIKWLPIEGMTDADAIQLYVENENGPVLETPLILLDPDGMDGTATSYTIPAGTLQPGRAYDVSLDAIRLADRDQTTVPGTPFGAANVVSTTFNLITTSGNRPPVIATESLGSATEGQPFEVGIAGSDPEDGVGVTFSSNFLPAWLELTDQGNGSAILSGTPTGSNIGTFTVRVTVADSGGLVSSRDYELTVGPDLTDPEGRALDIGSISWQRDGTAPFVAQIAEVQNGESALISGAVGDGVASSLQASFTGPLKLSFFWKVSSEAGKDFFRVRVDGVAVAGISGEQNWREQSIDVPAGLHTVRWAYEKDGSGSGGADRGWLDHLVILPPEAGVFAGTYLGEIKSSTGTVSLFVRPNNTAVFLGYHPESGKGLSNFAFVLSDLGEFSFEVVNPEDMNANYTVTGTISGGVATGSVSGLGLNFTANLISGGGEVVSYDGYYQNALTATTSGLVYLIVATDGQAYFFAQDRDYVEGYITTIDAFGNIALQTSKGFDYALQVDPTTDIVAGTYTPPGGETSSILGIREGSPGDELLANISTRGKVLTGGKIMIASFVITGTGSKDLLIRAIGPKLNDFGLQGVLQDPVINLVRLGELIPMRTNDDWGDDGQTNRIIEDSIRLGAFPLNVGGRDSVMAVSLEPGAYTAKIRGNGSLTGVSLVEVYDADDPTERLPTADVVNIATRGEVGTGPDALIAGFVVSGDVPKRVLVRGIGPQLTEFGVAGALEDPRIDLTNSDKELVATNDNWGDNPDVAAVSAAMTEAGAFDLLEGSKDAALLIWLQPGAYTAKVTGIDGGTGVALIEVYDN
ncbi:MAG: Ig domain-containing protein [Opitutaceae bacterium]